MLQRNFSEETYGNALPSDNLDGTVVPCKLFIGGLSYDTTDNSLAAYFSQFGTVASATVLRDPINSHSRGFGFVTFIDDVGARRVLAQSKNHIVDGRKVEAKFAFPKSQNHAKKPVMSSSALQYGLPLGLGISDTTFMNNIPMGLYENTGNYENHRLNSDIYPQSQRQPYYDFEAFDMPSSVAPSHKNQYNMSGTISSQSFHTDNFSPQPYNIDSSFADLGSYRGTSDSHSYRRKTVAHVEAYKDISQTQRELYLTQRINSLHIVELEEDKSKVFLLGIHSDTKEPDIRDFCATFGEVLQIIKLPQGIAEVTFRNSASRSKFINYQKLSGKLFLDGNEISVSASLEFLKKKQQPLLRRTISTSAALEGDKSHEFEADVLSSSATNSPLIRASSLTQNMLGSPSESVKVISIKRPLLRNDKNRSLSVIASASANVRSSLFENDVGRRSSTIADMQQRSLLSPASQQSLVHHKE